MPQIAVIDIGSNSIRMQISEVLGKSYKVVEDYKEILRIGDEVFLKGHSVIEQLKIFYLF